MPLCSVIIPVYNLAAVTRRCLDRVLADPPEAGAPEVIVVDDGSRDATPVLLAGYGDRIRVVTHPSNAGYATACNDGAAIARGQYLVFLNNDTVPLPGWLGALARYAAAHPAAAVVGSKLLYPDGTIQHAGMAIGQEGEPHHIYTGFPGDHPAVNRSRRFQMVTGACCLVRRAAFDRAGGFDTAFVNGYEDVDLCLRLGALGHEVAYCHESVLFHLESISEGRCARQAPNRRLYLERWKDRVAADDWRYYLEDGLIRITYPPSCPLQIAIDPQLGVVEQDGRLPEADRLLALRAQQVRDLLKETIRLGVARGADPLWGSPGRRGPCGTLESAGRAGRWESG
jgi:GT2 family glycosyltransferase